MQKCRWLFILCCLFVFGLTNLVHAQRNPPPVGEVLANNRRLMEFRRLLKLADPAILAWLSDPANEWTLFAPMNSAVEPYFNEGLTVFEFAEQYPERLNALLWYHIVPFKLDLTRLHYPYCQAAGTMQPNMQVTISGDDDRLFLNYYESLDKGESIEAGSGVIYPIDGVLAPLSIEARAGDHSPDVPEYVPPFGIFDLDTDLTEPAPEIATLPESDFRTVLEEDGRFITFLSLLETSPRVQALLDSDGLYTLFVPTDAAFEAYLAEEGLTLEKFEEQQAEDFMLNSVAFGYVNPAYLHRYARSNGRLGLCTLYQPEILTVDGEKVEFETVNIERMDETTLTADGIQIEAEVLFARNGIIYVTEQVRPLPFHG